MKKSIFFLARAMLLFLPLSSYANIIGIRADGDKEIFSISDALSIQLEDGEHPTMSVNMIDGTSSAGFDFIVFSDESSISSSEAQSPLLVYPQDEGRLQG